jgi:hypothetical protein
MLKHKIEPNQSISWNPPIRFIKNFTNQWRVFGGVIAFGPYIANLFTASSEDKPFNEVFKSLNNSLWVNKCHSLSPKPKSLLSSFTLIATSLGVITPTIASASLSAAPTPI